MIYRIADFNIEIEPLFNGTVHALAPYAGEAGAEAYFAGSVIKIVVLAMRADFEKYYGETAHHPSYIERLVLHKKISDEILMRGGFMMHGALIEYRGVGYMFTAKSGTGKTTHIELWKKHFGDDVHIVNGDKPFVRLIDGEIYAYGTPWCGKEGYNINTRVKLSKLCFIERAETNSIAKISELEAISRLMSQVDVVSSRDLGAQLAMLDELVSRCDMYLLKCNMDSEAAEVAYNGMK